MRKSLFAIFVLFIQSSVFSQSRSISGIVYDFITKQPIEFCNVIVLDDKQRGIVTDEKGKFTIEIENVKKIIFHSIGYKTDTLNIKPKQEKYIVHLKPTSIELNDIVITGTTRATRIKENPIAIVAISPKQIETTIESNIVDALVKNAPGLTSVKTGPNISKPFIHGLGYNRVLTLYDGVRQEGQQYGDEHGLEIDDYTIEKAEVIKGPASLLYGSDAIAGVVSLFPSKPKNTDRNICGKFTSEYQTNNGLIGNGLQVALNKNKIAFALRGSYRKAKNYKNPVDGLVYLTGYEVTNLSALVGYNASKGFTHINFTLFDNLQGIPDGSRDSLTRKFTKQTKEGDEDLIENRPIVSNKELNTYDLPKLVQRIQHYRIYSNSNYAIGNGFIDFLIGIQQNIRREFTHPTLPSQAGMFMRLNTLNYSFRYNAPKFLNTELTIGINGMLQNNKNLDATDFPIPDYKLYDGGAFIYAKWKYKKLTLSGGLRYDMRFVTWDDFYVRVNPNTGFSHQVTSSTNASLQFASFNNTYNGLSGSFGGTIELTKNINLKANLGRAYRAPTITEIGSNGLDPGAHIIYLGNRNFKPEFSLQGDIGINLKNKIFILDANVFNNSIENYIYMETIADVNGNPLLDNQGNRTLKYQQASAQLYGGEISLSYFPQKIKGFKIYNSTSIVYGYNRNLKYKNKGIQGEYLPLIPPTNFMSSISQEIILSNQPIIFVPKVELQFNATQNRYLSLNGTETQTPAYTLINIGVTAELLRNKYNKFVFTFQVNNVFDIAYQSHLNRLKYFEYYTNSTNGYYGIYNMGRNFALRMIYTF